MIGKGLKQIPSYKCTVPYNELNRMREDFWSSKFSSLENGEQFKQFATQTQI